MIHNATDQQKTIHILSAHGVHKSRKSIFKGICYLLLDANIGKLEKLNAYMPAVAYSTIFYSGRCKNARAKSAKTVLWCFLCMTLRKLAFTEHFKYKRILIRIIFKKKIQAGSNLIPLSNSTWRVRRHCSLFTQICMKLSNPGLRSQREDLSNQVICWRHIRAWNPAAWAPFCPSSMCGIIKLNIVASGWPLSFSHPCLSCTVPLSGVTRVLLIALKRGINRGGQ